MSVEREKLLEVGLADVQRQINELTDRRRDLEIKHDAERRLNRPSYPTPEQREGIASAARAIVARTQNESHLGDPCGPDSDPYCVSYSLGRGVQASVPNDGGVIYVTVEAPFGKRAAGRLWHLETHELDAIFAHVDACGFTVTAHWEHDRGVSLIVAPHTS